MKWLVLIPTAGFAWIALSMLVAYAKEDNPEERSKLFRAALGPLVLTLMGVYFAFYLS